MSSSTQLPNNCYYFAYNQTEATNQQRRIMRNYNNYLSSLAISNTNYLEKFAKNKKVTFLNVNIYSYMFVQNNGSNIIYIYMLVNGNWTFAGQTTDCGQIEKMNF